jgi:hypothetical protein
MSGLGADRPRGFGVEAMLTVWNRQADASVEITAEITDVSAEFSRHAKRTEEQQVSQPNQLVHQWAATPVGTRSRAATAEDADQRVGESPYRCCPGTAILHSAQGVASIGGAVTRFRRLCDGTKVPRC